MKNGVAAGVKVITRIEAGRLSANGNAQVRVGLKVKTALKGGKLSSNHNQRLR